MAKRRKKIEKIVFTKLSDKKVSSKPSCFGEHDSTCDKEVCGEYYSKCKLYSDNYNK